MSIQRWAAKADSSQKLLVKQLKQAGIQVWVIRQPCDLLLRFYCRRHRDHCWQTLEAKTAYGKKEPKVRQRSDQEKQSQFIEDTLTPVATDFPSAWRELNKRHTLGSVNTACVLNPIPA